MVFRCQMFSISVFWKAGSLPNNFMSRTQTRKESTPTPPSLYWECPSCSRWTAFQNPADLEWQECSRFQLQVPGINPDSLRPGRCKHTRSLPFYERTQTHPRKPRSAHAAQGAAERDRAPLERRPEPYRPISTKAECQRLLFDSGHQECGNNTGLTDRPVMYVRRGTYVL